MNSFIIIIFFEKFTDLMNFLVLLLFREVK